MKKIDILCVGAASFDLVFSVAIHPLSDEKISALSYTDCGGGPAANAAVTAARQGMISAFAGRLGCDYYGNKHFDELEQSGVITDFIVRDMSPTPLSVILVKPGGHRSLVNYSGVAKCLPDRSIDFSGMVPELILFDGHEPGISFPLARSASQKKTKTVLDAGSLHEGTRELMKICDYLVCSEKFAFQVTGETDDFKALNKLRDYAPHVIITLGDRGLVWKNPDTQGELPAFKINALDTTGAGDVFHGVFAACIVKNRNWEETLLFSSAAAALCCMKAGARNGIPTEQEVIRFLLTEKM